VSVHYSSERMDWATPAEIFAPLAAEFGFTLDVCATLENAKVPHFYPPETDGLAQDWSADVCWMNPPYGRAIGMWMRKAWEESRRGATVVCLVPSRTDTRWWHDYAARGEVRFLRGRVKFVGAKHGAPFPSAIVIFRPTAQEEAA
jgi:phage N-6-adenine-methyltransferase